MSPWRCACAAIALAVAGSAQASPTGDDRANSDTASTKDAEVVAFIDARIFDGTGDPVIDDGVVIVRDGITSEIGAAGAVDIPDGATVIDLAGRWLVPGFINTHGHVNAEGDRESIVEQLEIYAYYGVTTVLSLGDEGDPRRDERWSRDLRHARLFVSGPSLYPESRDEAHAEVNRVAAMEVDWVKMHVNASRGREYHADVIKAARALDLPAAIHIEELTDARSVLRAGAAMLAHSVRDEPVDTELKALMQARDACLVPTLTRELSTFVYRERPDFFDDPFFLERSAPDDLEAFLTPERREQATSPQAQYWRDALPLAKENMRALHEAGLRIAMGTDSGPSGRFQGYFEHVEMEMMVSGGLSPRDVLVSANGEAARCIGLAGTIGTITPGAWADLVVLDANPLHDIRNTRSIHGVWIAGNRIR